MQTIHLEFITPLEIPIIKRYGDKNEFYLLRFYNKEGVLLADIELPLSRIHMEQNRQLTKLFTYCINLQYVPLILFDNAHRISINRYKFRRISSHKKENQ